MYDYKCLLELISLYRNKNIDEKAEHTM